MSSHTRGLLTFSSEYAMGRECFHAVGDHATPAMLLPLLADYVADCQQHGRAVEPRTYRAYLAQYLDLPLPRLDASDDAEQDQSWKDPGERFTYHITPTAFTQEEGPDTLLHLNVHWRDAEHGWLEWHAFFYPEHLYRWAAQALRHQAKMRVRDLRHAFCRSAEACSIRVHELRQRADRLNGYADDLTTGDAPNGGTNARAIADRHRTYADVLSELHCLAVVAHISRGDGCLAITAELPGDRFVTARSYPGATLPARRDELTGWRVDLVSPYASNPLETPYVALEADSLAMVEAFAYLYFVAENEIALSEGRHYEGHQRRCPQCDHEVHDDRLPGEPCTTCTPGRTRPFRSAAEVNRTEPDLG
jgi:hypothetical protein